MTDEQTASENVTINNNTPNVFLVGLVVLCLALGRLFAARESLLTLARSVTPAGQAIVQAQAQQEIEKARKIEIENDRREADLAESRKRAEEFTRQCVRVIEVGLPIMAGVALIAFSILAGIVVVQTRRAAPDVRAALVHAAQLRSAQVKLDSGTRAFPVIVFPDGRVFNPNLQLNPGEPLDPKLAQAFAYIQALGVMTTGAARIAGRTSNPVSQAADALPGIAGQVRLIAIDDE